MFVFFCEKMKIGINLFFLAVYWSESAAGSNFKIWNRETDFVLDVCGMTSDGAKLFCLFFEILDFEI